MIDEEKIFAEPIEESENAEGYDFLVGVRGDSRLNDSLIEMTGNDGDSIAIIDDTNKLEEIRKILEEYSTLRLLNGVHTLEIPEGGTYAELTENKKKTQDIERARKMEGLKQVLNEILLSN